MKRMLIVAAAIALLSGCASFKRTQAFAFIDGEGNIMYVEHGERSSPYTYTLKSPMNGVEVECSDTKMVKITLPKPSEELLTGYICQNISPKGTMYETKDKKWRYLTIGLASRLYLWSPLDNDYILVFEGDNSPKALEGTKFDY